MLEIKDLSLSVDLRYLIMGLSITLSKGDKLAIIGEEGNGKSTLLKAIVGICDYAEVKGSINFKDYKIGYLKQFFDENELSLKVFDYLFSDQDEYYKKTKRYYKYLEELNIKEKIISFKLIDLSGGEKVKVGILKLLLDESDILLLDEPSNDLDISTLIWLENFIINTNKPIVFISHDETLLSKTANIILHLELIKKKQECKRTVIRDSYSNYIDMRFNSISKQTQQARFEKKEYDKQKEKLNQVLQKVNHQQNSITRADPHGGKMLKRKMKSLKSQENKLANKELTHIPEYEESINLFFEDVLIPSKKEIINVIIPELKKDNQVLVKDIDFKVYGRKKIVIIGKNGIGKTTFVKYIYNVLKDRKDINVGYMPQNYEDVFSNYEKPLDYLCPSSDKETISIIRSYLGNLNITREEMVQEIKFLSGGTKAKIFLLKLVLDKCNVLLLDEPTRNLSPLSNPVIRKILSEFNGTIISVSHDRKYIDEVCDVVYELTELGLKEVI